MDLIVTQKLMGHTSVLPKSRYLQTDAATFENLILNLAAYLPLPSRLPAAT